MKILCCFAICLTIFEVSSSPQGHFDLSPRFFLPSFFNNNQPLITARPRPTRPNILTYGVKIAALEAAVAALMSVNTLQNTVINNFQKSCQGTDPYAKEIDGVCYSLYSTALAFDLALTDCVNKGGFLAEPRPTILLSSFYNELKSKFATEITAIESGSENILIGATDLVTDNVFRYIQSGATVTVAAGNAVNSAPVFDVAALVRTTGLTLEATLSTTPSPYLCQFKFH